ncbi:hypothetical protein HOLleu_29289 [Holothuria leucospilota]|uniref:THAP-type domain-containing protein n=1 Tax=Holothuria leucospilota TaxID=206669 RepID=A0A9Q1BNI6_HOLLE|nr:hypothetical protein HOLleu_29289 [Holothuria leucospilota]
MVNTCSVIGCYNRSKRDKKSFFSIPSIIRHQGEQTEELSTRRRALWLTRLNRPNFVPTRSTKICSDHFVSGKPSTLYNYTNPDWAPSLGLNTYKKSVRGSKYRPKKKSVKNACSASSQADRNGGAPQSYASCLQTTSEKRDIPEHHHSIGKTTSFSHSPTTTASDGLMRLEVSRHTQKSYNQSDILNYKWDEDSGTESELENIDFTCHFPPESSSPTSLDHSYVKRPFIDKAQSSCELCDRYSHQEQDDSNSPEIEIVIPIENELELSQLPLKETIQPGVGIILGNTEQNSGNKEIADIVEKSENRLKVEDKGVYPVYLQSVDGEGWCL